MNKHLLSFFLAAAITGVAVPAPAQDARSDMRSAADALVSKFMGAWTDSSAKELAALFAPDADFINPWGTLAIGRPQIEAFYSGAFADGFAGSKGAGNVIDVRAITPDLAIVDANWQIIGARMPNGSPRPDEKGILVAVIRNTSYGWQILALRENTSATVITPLSAASR